MWHLQCILYKCRDYNLHRIHTHSISLNVHYLLIYLKSQPLLIVSILKFNCVIHRDIKGDHILLVQDKNNEIIVKFKDFGLSKIIEKNSKYYSFVGTDLHMAPEVKFQNGKAGSKSDIFCIGCTMIEMAGLNLWEFERDDKELKTYEPTIFESIGNYINYLSLPLYDQIITPGSIPPSVQYLFFNKLNQNLECDAISESVKYLDLVLRCGFNFTQPVNQRFLPHSVTDLQLYNYNINLKSNSIPRLVTSLTLGSNFTNIESLSFLPENVKFSNMY
ncbi:hypothetical protein ACTFIY_003578 [Dictyostelium cf. discoideum]